MFLTAFLRTIIFTFAGFVLSLFLMYAWNFLNLPEGDDVGLFVMPLFVFGFGIGSIMYAKKTIGDNWRVGAGGILGFFFITILLLLVVGSSLWVSIVHGTRMDAYTKFNLFEGFFWILLGCVFFVVSYRTSSRFKNFLTFTVGVLLLFGISDFMEIKFGSFLEDGVLWLLAWKIACVVGLIAALVWYIRLRISDLSY